MTPAAELGPLTGGLEGSEGEPAFRSSGRNKSPGSCKYLKGHRETDRAFWAEVDRRLAGHAQRFAVRAVLSIQALERQLDAENVDGEHRTGRLLRRAGWWEARIRGLATAAAQAETCGDLEKTLVCQDCGHRWTVPDTCDRPHLCRNCRDRALKKLRPLLEDQIHDAIHRSKPQDRLRMATLPVPHRGSTEDRVLLARRARAAWCRARREFEGRRVPWWAALEATSGDDGRGHLHWHVLEVGPYLPRPLAVVWWARAVGADRTRPAREALAELAGWDHRSRAELSRFATVPWGYRGAARRARKEAFEPYAVARVLAAPAGARQTSLATIRKRFRLGAAQLEALWELATVPHAVVDVRGARAGEERDAARELAKYTLKDARMPTELRAALAVALMVHRVRVLVSARGWGLRSKLEPTGCPIDGCGSPNIRIEQPKEGYCEAVERLAHWLSGRAPPELAGL